MKIKVFLLSFLCILLLSSCFNKEENVNKNVSTGSSQENVNSNSGSNNSNNASQKSNSGVVEDINLREEGDNYIFTDDKDKFSLTFPKSDNLQYFENYNGARFFIGNKKTLNTIGVLVEDYKSQGVDNFQDYFKQIMDKFEELKKVDELDINISSKEKTEVSGRETYKISFEIDGIKTEQYIISGDVAYILILTEPSPDESSDMKDIMDSFKIL